jgi:argininosuccinate lyase
LGFETLNYNVVYAQMGRGKTEKAVSFALSSLAGTLCKLAADICLYNSQNFGFIMLPENLTTGSSIMPHKKNPDVFELIRAKCNKIQALPNEISLIVANLPSGYHRDMQIIKESLFPAIAEMKACLEISLLAISQMRVKDNILDDDRDRFLFSVDAVNEEVLKGVPFREAYQKIAKKITEGTYQDVKLVNHTHEGSIGNLCNDQIKEKMMRAMRVFEFEKVNEAHNHLIGKK